MLFVHDGAVMGMVWSETVKKKIWRNDARELWVVRWMGVCVTYAAGYGVDMLICETDEGITLHTSGRRTVNDDDEDVVDLVNDGSPSVSLM